MSVLWIVIIVTFCVFTVVGFIIGVCKSYTRTSTWSFELIITTGCVMLITNFSNLATRSNAVFASVIYTCALVFILVLMLIGQAIKLRMEDGWGEDGGGAKFLGGLSLAFKGAMIVAIVFTLLIALFDMLGIESVNEAVNLASVTESGFWQFSKQYVGDFIIIALFICALHSGYTGGLLRSLWVVVTIGLVGLAGWASWELSQGALLSVGESLGASTGFMNTISESLIGSFPELTPEFIGTLFVLLFLFLIMLIVIIVLAIVVPRLIEKAREGATVRMVDGILGAVVLASVTVFVMLFVGGVLSCYMELGFMENVNTYFINGGLMSAMYDKNPLMDSGSLADFIRKISFVEYLS